MCSPGLGFSELHRRPALKYHLKSRPRKDGRYSHSSGRSKSSTAPSRRPYSERRKLLAKRVTDFVLPQYLGLLIFVLSQCPSVVDCYHGRREPTTPKSGKRSSAKKNSDQGNCLVSHDEKQVVENLTHKKAGHLTRQDNYSPEPKVHLCLPSSVVNYGAGCKNYHNQCEPLGTNQVVLRAESSNAVNLSQATLVYKRFESFPVNLNTLLPTLPKKFCSGNSRARRQHYRDLPQNTDDGCGRCSRFCHQIDLLHRRKSKRSFSSFTATFSSTDFVTGLHVLPTRFSCNEVRKLKNSLPLLRQLGWIKNLMAVMYRPV